MKFLCVMLMFSILFMRDIVAQRYAGSNPAPATIFKILVLLFVKYVCDRHAGQPFVAITIQPGARRLSRSCG